MTSCLLRDPETCPSGHQATRVTNKRNRPGAVWRRHRCLTCQAVWTSWQSLIDTRDIDPRDIDPSYRVVNQ